VDFLAGMTRKQRQRTLQIGLGFGMLVVVILVEVLAISPGGIYSYTKEGFRAFKIGAPKKRVLAEINHVPAIRTLDTCAPNSSTTLVTRRHFSYTKALDTANVWIARYRKENVLIFKFQDQTLVRILLLKTRFNREISSPLFDACRPDLLQNVDRFLETQTDHAVFYH